MNMNNNVVIVILIDLKGESITFTNVIMYNMYNIPILYSI